MGDLVHQTPRGGATRWEAGAGLAAQAPPREAGDLASEAGAQTLVDVASKAHGRIDVLINNAGLWIIKLKAGNYCSTYGERVCADSEVLSPMEANDNHAEEHTVAEFIEWCSERGGVARVVVADVERRP